MTILPNVVAETVLSQRPHDLTLTQTLWFVQHVEDRANHLTYRFNFDSNKGRERLYAFVRHWLEAYLLDPKQYQTRLGDVQWKKESES